MSTIERADGDLVELAFPYALDAVTDRERGEIEQRREHANRLTAAQFDATVSQVRTTLEDLTVVDSFAAPRELEGRLLAALDQMIRAARSRTRHRWTAFGSTSWPARLVAAVAVVLALGAAVVGVGYFHADRAQPGGVSAAMVAAQPDAVHRTATVGGGGELQIRASPKMSTAVVAFEGIPAPPAGRSYQVWLVPLGGTPRSVAVYDSLPAHPLVTRFDAVDTLAVTVEPAGGSAQPTTTPIAAINLD
ncbi:anti-sigma factor domain-containing protein [Nocardia sp. NPDC020380]|uniref:anti-sigma factor n=1 Tax=Nocardia sp. NPDC020380 TaxID=3364309 RepID=UPI0037B0D438